MGALPFNNGTLWLLRLLIRLVIKPGALPAGIAVQNTSIPGPDGKATIRLRIYRPQAAGSKAPALLWMHGGGMIGGVPEQDDLYVRRFVEEAGMVVVSVVYRMAPEHPFPAPLEDCLAAFTWMQEQAEVLGIDPSRLAVGGSSAGSGLAALVAQTARDRGGVQPVFQLLVYPMLDDRTAARSDIDPEGHFAWNNKSNRFGWEAYLKQPAGSASVPAGSVPARRADLSGLSPAWIGVGSLDLFHDEDTDYARRLNEAGVPCELVVVPGAFHGFDISMDPKYVEPPVVKEFRRSQVAALKRALG